VEVEVRQEQVRKKFRTAVQHLDSTENGNNPGTIGLVEEILNKNADIGSGCTGLIIGKHGNLSSVFLHICDLIANPSRVSIATTTASLLTMHRGCSDVRSTAVGD
jgi:hypothetical protein